MPSGAIVKTNIPFESIMVTLQRGAILCTAILSLAALLLAQQGISACIRKFVSAEVGVVLKTSYLSTPSSVPMLFKNVVKAAVAAPGVRAFDMIQSDPWDLQVISYWGEKRYCKVFKNVSLYPASRLLPPPTSLLPMDPPAVLLNVTFGCRLLFQDHRLGTGNHISSMLGMRLAALRQGADLLWQCYDAEAEKANLVMPWIMGFWPAAGGGATVDAKLGMYPRPPGQSILLSRVPLNRTCEGYDGCPIAVIVPIIIYALRRMAVSLVGVPATHHPAAKWAEQFLWGPDRIEGRLGGDTFQLASLERGEPPLIPDIELDDTVVHFRCGDIAHSNHPSFGFMRFSEFAKRISPTTTSIGIVTQPFHIGGQLRSNDSNKHTRKICETLTTAMVEYMASAFPHARIRIRNNANETIALTYARMVMANQTFSPISSFSVFPAVANFGIGYVRRPDFPKAPNKWMVNSVAPTIEDMFPGKVELMSSTDLLLARNFKLLADKTKEMKDGVDYQVEWFTNDTCCP